MSRALVRIGSAVAVLVASAFAQDPCVGQHARTLVMGGGGTKGAFEAGASYHLIVHRGCDFAEFSGTSVGALNSAVLAQAPRSDDAAMSLANLKSQTDSMVAMWRSIRKSSDVLKSRPLATLRFGLFGLEGMKNFAPLRRLLAANVDLEKLDRGRELRIATVSFDDGRYRELVLNPNGQSDKRTLHFLLASTAIPMFAAMPRIADESGGEQVQFGDGGLRHNAPVTTYFVQCASGDSPSRCRSVGNHGIASHPRLEQVFIISTNPYERDAETTPVWDDAIFNRGTHQIRDGRKVMSRTINILLESSYHGDLDSILLNNEILKWRKTGQSAATTTGVATAFPIESYNYDPQQPDGPSRPYQIALVTPPVGDGGLDDVLSFSPERIAKQMYCGCVAADEMMQSHFGLESMSTQCKQQFFPNNETAAAPDCRSRLVERVWRAASERKGSAGSK